MRKLIAKWLGLDGLSDRVERKLEALQSSWEFQEARLTKLHNDIGKLKRERENDRECDEMQRFDDLHKRAGSPRVHTASSVTGCFLLPKRERDAYIKVLKDWEAQGEGRHLAHGYPRAVTLYGVPVVAIEGDRWWYVPPSGMGKYDVTPPQERPVD